RVAAQIQITVFGTQFLAAVGVILYLERWRFGLIQYFDCYNLNFNFAGRYLQVLAGTLYHLTANFDHKLAAQAAAFIAQGSIAVSIKNKLSQSVTVADINKR